MTFGEKLLKLRKEKGLSQEALAEQLNTTRQAVSKWENDQGYPETEKLLMMSNLFHITVDALLKETAQASDPEGSGYYVSRECAEGFLLRERKVAKRVSAGMGLLIGAVVPLGSLGLDTPFSMGAVIVLLSISIGSFATALFLDDPYQQLSKEPLLLDHAFYGELRERYVRKKKQLAFAALFGVGALVTGGIMFKYGPASAYPTKAFCCVLLSAGMYSLCCTLGILDAYETLLNSEERLNRFHVRIWRKLRDQWTK